MMQVSLVVVVGHVMYMWNEVKIRNLGCLFLINSWEYIVLFQIY